MKKLAIFLMLLAFTLTACQSFVDNALQDKRYTVLIKQRVGGTLICYVQFYDDFQSWNYLIDYRYKDTNNVFHDLGTGSYDGQNWLHNEQVIIIKHWIILPTSASKHSDKLYVNDFRTNKLTEYIISPERIEQDSAWKETNSSFDNYDSFSKIKAFDSTGKLSAIYQFALKKRNFPYLKKTGKRIVNYKFNPQTGNLKMIDSSVL